MFYFVGRLMNKLKLLYALCVTVLMCANASDISLSASDGASVSHDSCQSCYANYSLHEEELIANEHEVAEVFASFSDQEKDSIEEFLAVIFDQLKIVLGTEKAQRISALFRSRGYRPRLLLNIALFKERAVAPVCVSCSMMPN